MRPLKTFNARERGVSLPGLPCSTGAIVIMAKAPERGRVKTRLSPPLSMEEASLLYRGFLLDKIEQVKGISGTLPVIAYTPAGSEGFFKALLPGGFLLRRQVGGDLGERLRHAAGMLFSEGFSRVILLDSDTPHLPPGYIREGLRRLDESDIVIGPCDDGGYYLVGMRRHTPGVFSGIPWSTPAVTERTVEKALSLGLTVSLLGTWFDVDTLEDLLRLKTDLDAPGDHAGLQFSCSHTRTVLSGLDLERFF